MAWEPFMWLIFAITNLTLLGLNFYQVFSPFFPFSLFFFPIDQNPFGSLFDILNAVFGCREICDFSTAKR